MTTEFPDIAEGTLVAIPVPWAHSASGCVEWQLTGWTLPDDDGKPLPIWADVAGDTGAWGSDYALRGPRDSDWRFPDGERSSDEALAATFECRRAGAHHPPPLEKNTKPNRRQRRIAKAQQRRQPDRLSQEEIEEALESLEAEGKVYSEVGADGEKRWIARPPRLQ